MKNWLKVIGITAVFAAAGCGSDEPPREAGIDTGEANRSSAATSAATSSAQSARAQASSSVGAESKGSVSAKPAQGARQGGAGDSQAENQLMKVLGDAESGIRACADNACLHTEMRALSAKMKQVNDAGLSREQLKRLLKRAMDVQRLAASQSK